MKTSRPHEIRPLLTGGDRRSIADSNRARLLVEKDSSLVIELANLTADKDWLIAQRALDLLEKLAHDHEDAAPQLRAVAEQGPSGESETHSGTPREGGQTRMRVLRGLLPIVQALAIVILVTSPARAGEPDFARLFAGRDGCFELYDLKTNKLVVRSNPGRCAQRTSPCSTFKVPLALMAFDSRILEDENSAMKWDGTKTSRDEWNRDQTAATWMKNSVVWFSQRLTPKLGMQKVKTYLSRFDFGNQDMSGGLTRAWLESSLQVSPDEELRFWQRFWDEELPVSKHALDMTKRITLVGVSPSGWTLHGKTGSGAVGANGPNKAPVLWLGWFVGHVARGDREYVFVTSYSDRVESADRRPAGWIARDITKGILAKMGLY